MITIKVLLKAMSFMFFPTIALLTVIFCWFLNWTAFVSFITSQTDGAGALRLVMIFLEISLVVYMYNYYTKEEIGKDATKEHPHFGTLVKQGHNRTEIGNFANTNSEYVQKANVYKKTKDIYIIEIKERSSNS